MKLQEKRDRMVIDQLLDRGIKEPKILEVMANVRRHLFVPKTQQLKAYTDAPLPIGHQQTISQPYMVALMCEALQVNPGMKVLEVGTGSGYQTAILSALGAQVYSVERIPELADWARKRLNRMGFDEVQTRTGNGARGWPEAAPFDRILVSAAAPELPKALWNQLVDRGRIVIPLGVERRSTSRQPAGFPSSQNLTVVTRDGDEAKPLQLVKCLFVPLVS
jgi:protein-L-isoaspartate(D-aspartate) O-methyltransferase